jgi:hypothetical protein
VIRLITWLETPSRGRGAPSRRAATPTGDVLAATSPEVH